MKRLSCLCFVCWVLCQSPVAFSKPMNVVFIVADDMNGYGFYHDYPGVKMPYMDRFRESAVTFTNAHCATPKCAPSRAAFFSGLYPHITGCYRRGGNNWKSGYLKDKESMPECFQRNNYFTWGGGKIFHNSPSAERMKAMWDWTEGGDFGLFLIDNPERWAQKHSMGSPKSFSSYGAYLGDDDDFPTSKIATEAVAFLKQGHTEPFFLYYGLWRPHTPYTCPKRFFDMYDINNIIIPPGYLQDDLADVPEPGRGLVDSGTINRMKEAGQFQQYLLAYLACTTFSDWCMGRVIDALDESPYADNTLVVVISDHGYHVGEKEHWQKSNCWGLAARSPMAVRVPGMTTAGQVCAKPVNFVDIFPTLVDYCGIEPPQTHRLVGSSLRPLLNNPQAEWDRPSLTTWGKRFTSLCGERYRYIQYPDGTEELYDHQNDPHEWHNLAGIGAYETIKQEMKKYVPQQWHD